MNTKLHAICDSQGRPLDLFVTAGQVSDYIVARALLSSLPKVDWLLGDRGDDADWFREALQDKGIRACITKSHPRNLLSMATLNKARSLRLPASSSRARIAQTCLGSKGRFWPMIRPLFQALRFGVVAGS